MLPSITIKAVILNHVRKFMLDVNMQENMFITLKCCNEDNVYDLIDLSSGVNVNTYIKSQLINVDECKVKGNCCCNSTHSMLLQKVYERLTTQQQLKPFDGYFIIKQNNSLQKHTLKCKAFTIFPNVNFKLKQIQNISFSNTHLNNLLLSNQSNVNMNNPSLKSGYLTMSKNHHLIALQNSTNQTFKQIIFGIWLNFKDEQTPLYQIDLDNFINKHKYEIYMKCFEFIQRSSHIDTIYSHSPDKSVFILVLFYQNMQCQYEVSLFPNEEHQFNQYGCNWLIKLNEIELDCNENDNDVIIDVMNNNNSRSELYTVNEFINSKAHHNSYISKCKSITNERVFEYKNINVLSNDDNNNDLHSTLFNKEEGYVLSRASTNTHSNKISSYNNSKNCFRGLYIYEENNQLKEAKELVNRNEESIRELEMKVDILEIEVKKVLNKLLKSNEYDDNNEKLTEEEHELDVSKDKSIFVPKIIVPNISYFDD